MVSPTARALPALVAILAGCAAPPSLPWIEGPALSVPAGEEWGAGGGADSYSSTPPPDAGGRKSLMDPDTFLWRAGAGYWKPSLAGDGWYRGDSADGVDAAGTGGGASLGFRRRAVSRPGSSGSAEYAPPAETTEWAMFYGADLAAFSGSADSGGDSGRLGAADLDLVMGFAHVPYGGRRSDFLAEFLVGVRRASIDLEGDALASIQAEESRAKAGFLAGVNLEFSPRDGITFFGRFDGSFAGTSESDEFRTIHAFAGIRAALGDHLSIEGGWRYYKVDVTLRESRTYFFIFIPVTETYKVQEASLTASGPWIGLVYDF